MIRTNKNKGITKTPLNIIMFDEESTKNSKKNSRKTLHQDITKQNTRNK